MERLLKFDLCGNICLEGHLVVGLSPIENKIHKQNNEKVDGFAFDFQKSDDRVEYSFMNVKEY